MEHSNLSIIIFFLGSFIILCIVMVCIVRKCCPFWLSEKLGIIRERIYHTSELQNYSKSPSLFSFHMNNRSTPTTQNIPIVIVSDENGKRVMGGKDVTCIYEKQDLEEVL